MLCYFIYYIVINGAGEKKQLELTRSSPDIQLFLMQFKQLRIHRRPMNVIAVITLFKLGSISILHREGHRRARRPPTDKQAR